MMNEFKNLQKDNNLFLNMEFQQKQIMMMGGKINKQKQLSREEIEQLRKDWFGMFYALTSINWGMGMTLGASWQKALEQMDAFVMSKLKIKGHVANEPLLKMHKEFRRDMAKSIMESEYGNEKLPEHLKKSFLDYGQKSIKKYKAKIDDLYKQHMPETDTAKQVASVKFDVAKQKTQQLMQQILMQQMTNQRAA